jgi:hypothetical protein
MESWRAWRLETGEEMDFFLLLPLQWGDGIPTKGPQDWATEIASGKLESSSWKDVQDARWRRGGSCRLAGLCSDQTKTQRVQASRESGMLGQNGRRHSAHPSTAPASSKRQ